MNTKAKNLLFEIADSIGIPLDVTADKIRGKSERQVELGPMLIAVPLHVVSSLVAHNGTAVLCKSLGNLSMLVIAEYGSATKPVMSIALLDQLKLGSPNDFIEKSGWHHLSEVLAAVKEKGAVVASFVRKGPSWEAV